MVALRRCSGILVRSSQLLIRSSPFNVNISDGIPYVVNEMLMFSLAESPFYEPMLNGNTSRAKEMRVRFSVLLVDDAPNC